MLSVIEEWPPDPDIQPEALLAAGRVELAFQPVVRTRGGIAFFEGLARLRSADGLLAPAAFLPALEAAGLGPKLDRFVLRHALAALEATPGTRISVNVGADTLSDAAWIDLLQREAADRPGLTDRLIVEVTETALLDSDRAARFTRAVRALGPAVLLDDFGAGYTAFRQFRDLALDGVKIDGFFTRRIEASADNQCLIRALVDIARHFEMFTVAEYVQTATEAECLSALGVDGLQGHFIGAAGPALTLGVAHPSAGVA